MLKLRQMVTFDELIKVVDTFKVTPKTQAVMEDLERENAFYH